jgi:hypothetical protein
MSQNESFTFYSYACVDENSDDRWAYTGIPEIFSYDEDGARGSSRAARRCCERTGGQLATDEQVVSRLECVQKLIKLGPVRRTSTCLC